MSRARSASYISRPRPGQAVTNSTTNEPDSSAPIASPYTAQIGRSDTGHACRTMTSRGSTPRAIAASVKGWCSASVIDCACSRSNVAAIGSASASAGSGR